MIESDFIFLSASVPHRKDWLEGSHPVLIEEAIVSLARAVFARKGRLVFGGHPSVSPLIASIAGEYYAPDPTRTIRPIVTFQSEFFKENLPDKTWDLHRMGWSTIEWTPNVGNRDLSLTVMRNWMLGSSVQQDAEREIVGRVIKRNEMQPPRAMVAIGGMEGIVEEAAIFLRESKSWDLPRRPPVFAITTGGGAAAELPRPWQTWSPPMRRALEQLGAESQNLFMEARNELRIIGLEDAWWSKQSFEKPADLEVEPYAAMMQWAVDAV